MLFQLPPLVVREGILVSQVVPSMLTYVNLFSTDPDADQKDLFNFANVYVMPRLKRIPGMGIPRNLGNRVFAMRVWLDRSALAARNLTVQDVETALRRENAELPAGRIESAQREFTVRTDTRLSRAEQFSRIVISQRSGDFIRLGDVARVELGTRDDRGDYTVNARAAVGLGVTLLPRSALDAYRHPDVRVREHPSFGTRCFGLVHRDGAEGVPATAALVRELAGPSSRPATL